MTAEHAPIDREALAARAIELRYRNFNCAQAVACALAPLVGADEDVCFRASEAFGGGMGGHTETCGAISGGALALGLANSNGMADPSSKQATYALVARLVARFREQNGSTICADLRGEPAGTPLRSCDGCIEDALVWTLDLIEELRANPR
ncbi:C-GCAxxG-C-C family protein [Arabiibacter massiliensis]|uniref:C-GCAxxG-C-C family protein n=1 Tax=Arabiibacter massiliensis TaxID=1870985 RepID=UPI0009BACB7C|nr:C-GCAxxG-C-C family protein [Arabiibacter massiliensis]